MTITRIITHCSSWSIVRSFSSSTVSCHRSHFGLLCSDVISRNRSVQARQNCLQRRSELSLDVEKYNLALLNRIQVRSLSSRAEEGQALDEKSVEERTKNRRPRIHGDRQRDRVVVDLSSRKSKLETIEVPPGVLDGRFMLSPEKVAALQRQYNLSEDELLEVLITPASQQARPPISSFHVGAAGLADSGAVYIGCNLEFANLPLYNSVHAEQFLLVNALHHGERGIKKIAVSAAPCGHCRQFFSELNCANSIRFSFSGGSYSLGQLLPKRFGPLDLLMDPNSPLLLDPQDNHLELVPEARDYLDSLADNISKSTLRKAAEAAFNESRHSYSPYSRSPAGVAIVTEDEEVYSGHYIECAAYNPSLPPLQTAIIDAIIDGMPTYAIVRHVVLVEVENAPVQHAGTVRVVLEQIAPEAELQVLYAQWAAE